MRFIPVSSDRRWMLPTGEMEGAIFAYAHGDRHELGATLEQRFRKAHDSAAAQAVAAFPDLDPGGLRERGPAVCGSEDETARCWLWVAVAQRSPGAACRRS